MIGAIDRRTVAGHDDHREEKVQRMYRAVATAPGGAYHFELGRPLAARLCYPAHVLDRIPAAAIESFAGVGYFFDLAELGGGEHVIDLGSGSGMEVLFAATQVGATGRVGGVDFTAEQLAKARRLAAEGGFDQVAFSASPIERVPADDESADCVISNGVINLSPDKPRVFADAARVLRPGGRLAIADVVQRAATEGLDRVRRRSVGVLHRRRRPAGRLPGGDRGRRTADRADQEEPVRVHLSASAQSECQVRRQERLAAGAKGVGE